MAAGDTLVIKAGDSITIDGVVTFDGVIQIYGVLVLDNGKLNMDAPPLFNSRKAQVLSPFIQGRTNI